MKKAVALVKDDPKLEEFIAQARELDKGFHARTDFLNTQIKKLNEEHAAARKDFYERVHKYAIEKGLLPEDFNEKKGHHVEFDSGESCLRICYDCNPSRGLADFLHGVFN
jgi:hypothetical protein